MASEPMAQENTADAAKRLFASVMEPGEDIKILVGQRVVLNESEVGKPQDRLDSEIFAQLSKSVLTLDEQRVEIQTTEKGNPKAPEFEVLAIGEKGPDGKAPTRTLFRQERGAELPTSVNLVGDLLASLIEDTQIEGQQDGYQTYVIAHQAIDRDENQFSPDLEGYSEEVRENPHVRSLTLEAYKEGFELGQQTGKETFPEIAVLKTEVAGDLAQEESTSELIGTDSDASDEQKESGRLNPHSELQRIFGPILEPGEKLEIINGQTSLYRETEKEGYRDSLSHQAWSQLKNSALHRQETRIDVPLTDTGSPKAAKFEVLAISIDQQGKSSARTLLRQENTRLEMSASESREVDLPISINLVDDFVEKLTNRLDDVLFSVLDKEDAEDYSRVWQYSTRAEATLDFLDGTYKDKLDGMFPEPEKQKILNFLGASDEEWEQQRSTLRAGQSPSLEAAQDPQYWADDMDKWLGDQSEEILQQPDIEDAFEADDVSAKSVTLDNSQPIDDQAIEASNNGTTYNSPEDWEADVEAESEWPPEIIEGMEEEADVEDAIAEEQLLSEEPYLTDTLSFDRDEATTTSPSSAAEQTEGEDTVQEPQADSVSSGNTIAALFQSIEQLPEGSSARHIAENLATELQAHASEIKAREEKAQNRKNWLEEGSSAIKASVKTIQRTVVQTKDSIQSAPIKDAVVGIALKSVGAIADMSGKGLKAAGQYLKNRAQKVEEYGMAKAAVTIHRKGHSRTGEDSFTKDGYTVQKQGNAYSVLDTKNRAVMTFETNRKGQPINVTQTDAAQKEDKWAVGRIAKSSVILGSSEKEKAYEEKLRAIATVASDLLGESHEADGKNFRVSREDGGIAVSTKTFPSRSAQINALGEVESDLTRDDLNQLGRSLTIAVDYATEEAYKTKDKVEITV